MINLRFKYHRYEMLFYTDGIESGMMLQGFDQLRVVNSDVHALVMGIP